MIGAAGSGTFLYAFGRDPFLVNGRLLSIEPLTGSPTADFTIPGTATDLRLSPGGRQVAVMKHQMTGVAGFSVGTTGAFSIGAPGSVRDGQRQRCVRG
jgi:hypothetical protein